MKLQARSIQTNALPTQLRIYKTKKQIKLLKKLYVSCLDSAGIDRLLSIKTKFHNNPKDYNESLQGVNMDSVGYTPSTPQAIALFMEAVNIKPYDVLFDVGCGKGRVCFSVAPFVKKVIGIDHNPGLIKSALRNHKSYRKGRFRDYADNIYFTCEDIVNADLDEGTIYHLFRPFREKTFKMFLERIKKSLINKPRPIQIFYFGYSQKDPEHKLLTSQASWLKPIILLNNQPYALFSNV